MKLLTHIPDTGTGIHILWAHRNHARIRMSARFFTINWSPQMKELLEHSITGISADGLEEASEVCLILV